MLDREFAWVSHLCLNNRIRLSTSVHYQIDNFCFLLIEGMRFAIMQMKTALYEVIKSHKIIPKEASKDEKEVKNIFVSGKPKYIGFERI